MKSLVAKTAAGTVISFIVMSAALFLPAGTLNYWQAWVFLAVFFTSSVAITVYLLRVDRALVERRVHSGPGAETESSQKVIQALIHVCFIALLIVPALDHRFKWSDVPAIASIAGDALILIGLASVLRVFR